jgi:hypothetical protein
MDNRGAWRVALGLHGNRNRPIPVTMNRMDRMDRIYDKTTGYELTQSEIRSFEETIEQLRHDLSSSNNENRGLRERVVEAETIVSNIRMASESSHNKNPYPQTQTTSESLNTELDELCNFYKLKIDFPNEFLCPITGQIMVDPVTTSGGHTYEWSAISRWFREGKNRDPATGLELNNNILYPNHALRSVINNFISTCKLIINEVRKKEVLNKTQRSIRMRSAPAEYGTRSKLYVKPNISTRSMLVSKTRTKSKVKATSKSRASTSAKAPSSPRFIQELDAQE